MSKIQIDEKLKESLYVKGVDSNLVMAPSFDNTNSLIIECDKITLVDGTLTLDLDFKPYCNIEKIIVNGITFKRLYDVYVGG